MLENRRLLSFLVLYIGHIAARDTLHVMGFHLYGCMLASSVTVLGHIAWRLLYLMNIAFLADRSWVVIRHKS